MATITKKNVSTNNIGATPWGNLAALHYAMETNASGAVVDSNSTAAVAIGDVVRLGVIPAGTKLLDSFTNVVTTLTTSVTGKIGFAYVDGVDSTAVPQDDDYFAAAGLALATAALTRKTTAVASVTLPKDAYLILTTAGAANAKAGRVEVTVLGITEGVA